MLGESLNLIALPFCKSLLSYTKVLFMSMVILASCSPQKTDVTIKHSDIGLSLLKEGEE